jgi:hypothetical protein
VVEEHHIRIEQELVSETHRRHVSK